MKNDKDISYGYKFVDGNIGMSEEGIVTLPLYMSAFIWEKTLWKIKYRKTDTKYD